MRKYFWRFRAKQVYTPKVKQQAFQYLKPENNVPSRGSTARKASKTVKHADIILCLNTYMHAPLVYTVCLSTFVCVIKFVI